MAIDFSVTSFYFVRPRDRSSSLDRDQSMMSQLHHHPGHRKHDQAQKEQAERYRRVDEHEDDSDDERDDKKPHDRQTEASPGLLRLIGDPVFRHALILARPWAAMGMKSPIMHWMGIMIPGIIQFSGIEPSGNLQGPRDVEL